MITNYTINLDRLELMLLQDTTDFNVLHLHTITPDNARKSYSIGDVTLYQTEPTGHYLLQYDIECKNLIVGYLRLQPTAPTAYHAGKPLLSFKVANSLLYTNWLPTIGHVFATLRLTSNNITKYEIALDTNADANSVLLDNFHDENKWFIVETILPTIS